MRWIVALIAVPLLGCSPRASPDPQVAEMPTGIVRSARIFDGEEMVSGATVLLGDDRILALVDGPERVRHRRLPDGLAHIFDDELVDRELAALAARVGVFIVPTLTTIEGVYQGPSGAGLVDDDRFYSYLHPAAIENLRAAAGGSRTWLGSFENALENTHRFHQAGVRILAGTDATNPGTAHGISLHRELELLVRAGLTPLEALTAATRAPAEAFGLDDRGRIAPGLRADLLLIRGDPARNIGATLEIVAVIRGGVHVDREALGAVVRASPE